MSRINQILANDETIIENRVAIFADRELNLFLKEVPLTINEMEDIDWEVSNEGSKYYAEGTITIPIKVTFNEGNTRNDFIADDFVLSDIEIDGISQYGVRFVNPKKEGEFDPLDSVDIPRAIAQAHKEHWS